MHVLASVASLDILATESEICGEKTRDKVLLELEQLAKMGLPIWNMFNQLNHELTCTTLCVAIF